MRRTRFFFAFKKEAQVYHRLHGETTESIERCEHGNDRSLVIAGRAGAKAPLRLDGFRVAPIDIAASAVTHDRLPWFAFPLGDCDWLSLVVGVDCYFSLCIPLCQLRDSESG